jgi:hypothetical protein
MSDLPDAALPVQGGPVDIEQIFGERRKKKVPRILTPSERSEQVAAQRRFFASIDLALLREAPHRHRNLVFVQCTRAYSRQSVLSSDRAFDLMLNLFDGATLDDAASLPVDIVTAQRGTKCTAISTLLSRRPDLLLRYDRVLFLDDDIAMTTAEIAHLFEAAEAGKMHLCQPSLSADSHVAWRNLKQPNVGPGPVMVSALEIMAPCLSREALQAGAWVFGTSVSGYGTDLLLSSYLSRTHSMDCFVIGQVVAHHERQIDKTNGSFYRYLRTQSIDPLLELALIQEQYGIEARISRINPLPAP